MVGKNAQNSYNGKIEKYGQSFGEYGNLASVAKLAFLLYFPNNFSLIINFSGNDPHSYECKDPLH